MEVLTDRKAYVKATNADGVCILEATAAWCPQCKAIDPFVQKLVKQFPDAKFYKFDVDTAPDIAQELGVSQMPTFNVFKDGEVQDGVTGAKPQELLKAIRASYQGEEIEGGVAATAEE